MFKKRTWLFRKLIWKEACLLSTANHAVFYPNTQHYLNISLIQIMLSIESQNLRNMMFLQCCSYYFYLYLKPCCRCPFCNSLTRNHLVPRSGCPFFCRFRSVGTSNVILDRRKQDQKIDVSHKGGVISLISSFWIRTVYVCLVNA